VFYTSSSFSKRDRLLAHTISGGRPRPLCQWLAAVPSVRALDVGEPDKLEEAQLAGWVKQVSQLPGWGKPGNCEHRFVIADVLAPAPAEALLGRRERVDALGHRTRCVLARQAMKPSQAHFTSAASCRISAGPDRDGPRRNRARRTSPFAAYIGLDRQGSQRAR